MSPVPKQVVTFAEPQEVAEQLDFGFTILDTDEELPASPEVQQVQEILGHSILYNRANQFSIGVPIDETLNNYHIVYQYLIDRENTDWHWCVSCAQAYVRDHDPNTIIDNRGWEGLVEFVRDRFIFVEKSWYPLNGAELKTNFLAQKRCFYCAHLKFVSLLHITSHDNCLTCSYPEEACEEFENFFINSI